MERGEVGVLAVQFAALAIILLIFSNFATVTDITSTPEVNTVYWGPSSSNIQLAKGATSTESVNESTITVDFALAESTTPSSITAARLCLNNLANDTSQPGQVFLYTNIPLVFNPSKDTGSFTFGPTEQTTGLTCTYTVTVTDSLEQQITWFGGVTVH